MITRIVVGLLALPIILVPIWLGGIWCLILLLLVASVGGMEMFALLEKGGYRPSRWLGLIWLLALVATGWQPGLPWAVPLITAGSFFFLAYALFIPEKPLHTWLATSGAAIYLGVTLGQALALRQLPDGLWWLLFGVLVTWMNDTAAYFAGVTVGRHPLWPRISPKKTWEGTVAGWLGSALFAILLVAIFPLSIPWYYAAGIGTLSGIFALIGDLSISMLKRQIGVKDTSHLIPGHGGVLDRLDSILFVLPLIYQIVSMAGW